MIEQERESSEDAVEAANREASPVEGKQEQSHESEDTLSPDTAPDDLEAD
jgi:hypothetical protein